MIHVDHFTLMVLVDHFTILIVLLMILLCLHYLICCSYWYPNTVTPLNHNPNPDTHLNCNSNPDPDPNHRPQLYRRNYPPDRDCEP